MKKWIKASIAATFVMGLSLNLSLLGSSQNRLDLNVSTNDKFNEEKGINKIDLRQASSGGEVENSKIFTQYAQNDAGQYFLRFATAVKGDLESITYDLDILDTEGLDFENHSVTTVYSSISSGDSIAYFNGTRLVSEKTEDTLDWYWATLVIEFDLQSPYLDSSFGVNVNINGVDVAQRETSLDEVIELSTENAIDVYFIAGQSNAGGCSDYYRSDLATPNISFENQKKMSEHVAGYDNVLYYGSALGQTGSGTKVTKLTPTKVGFGSATNGREIGPELGMAEYLAERYQGTKRKALIIKYAAVSSGIVTDTNCEFGEWSAPSYPNPGLGTQQNLFDNMMGVSDNGYQDGVVYKALKLARDAGYNKVNYKGFFWSQGCGDQNNHTYYGEALAALKGDFRTRINEVSNALASQYENINFSDASKLPFLISEMCVTGYNATRLEDNTSSSANINAIINHQRTVAANDVNAESLKTYMYNIVKNTTGYQSKVNDGISYCADEWHYNADDMLDGGRRAASILYTFKVDEGACQHQFGEYIITEKDHTQICDLCGYHVKEEHKYVHSFDGEYHFEQCKTCENIINKEPHSISELEAVSTKQYNWKDELDETAFEVYSSTCSCGLEGTKITDYEVTFNTEYADYNTIATITAGGASTSVKLDVNAPFGRQIECNDENGIKDSYIVKLLNRQIVIADSKIKAYTTDGTTGGSVDNNDFEILKSLTTDGEYIYALINGTSDVTATSGYNVGIIVKINTKGEVVGYSSKSYYWGTTGVRIGYLNGSLIVYNTTEGKKNGNIVAYSGKATSFIGKQLEFDPETLELKNADYSLISNFDVYPDGYTSIQHMTSTNDGSKVAMIYVAGGVKYIYAYERDVDGSYKCVNYKEFSLSGSIQGISISNDYIYFTSYTGADYKSEITTISVYSWDLNEIGNVKKGTDLDTSGENSYYPYNSQNVSTSTNVNQNSYPYGCVEIDGKIYYGGACWKGVKYSYNTSNGLYKGTYIYRIDIK